MREGDVIMDELPSLQLPGPLMPADGLPAFLRRVADLLEADTADGSSQFARVARRFLDGGRAAICAPDAVRWLEYRLQTRPAAIGEVYTRLARLAVAHLDADAAEDFFFVRKGPVLRVRFLCRPAGRTNWTRLP